MPRLAATALFACVFCGRAAGYATYIGDQFPYNVAAAVTDANGNTYVAGNRVISLNLPGIPIETSDIFVSKVDSAGTVIPIATFSGKGIDEAKSIAVDGAGNIYIAGETSSTDFPLRHPLQTNPGPTWTGFLIKLAADGTTMYSTYLGGTAGPSGLNGVAADSRGNAYVTGWTTAADYPHTQGLPAGPVALFGGLPSVTGAFFAKISSTGDQILYAGVLSTSRHDCGGGSSCFLSPVYTWGAAIALDPAGNAYIAGNGGGGLPTTAGALVADGIGAFVARINASGAGIDYLTYLGTANYYPPPVAPGSNPGNMLSAIATDADGNAYLSGYTSDPGFPATPGALQTALASPQDQYLIPPSNAFAAKLSPAGSAMVWATFLGGTGPDAATTIAPDGAGNVWVSGTTQSANFPQASGWPKGSEFLVELNATGSALEYSALYPADTVAAALAIDSADTVHTAGGAGLLASFSPGSAPTQVSAPWVFGIANSAGGRLAGRLVPGELFSIYGLRLGPETPAIAGFDSTGALPSTLGGVTVTVNGVPAPLLYASGTQINAVAPVGLTARDTTELRIVRNGSALPSLRTVIDSAAPQVFRNPDGSAAAINQDGTVNSAANPAPRGSYVSVWATGTGYFQGSDGQMATTAEYYCALSDNCGIIDGGNGSLVSVPYIGAAPGIVNGVVQINFQTTASGSYYFSVNGADSDPFSVFVQP